MDLDYRHPLYEANLGRWNYYRASYLGGFDYRNSSLGMLPQQEHLVIFQVI